VLGIAKALYDKADLRTQARVDRARYALGLLPRVNPQVEQRREAWLPAPYKSALIISADFELAWAWRYVKGAADPQAIALQKAEQTRRNLPVLLKLFDDFNVPVTWATVGHLFLERCAHQDGRPHPDFPRLPYFENEHWRYTGGDWFDGDPCSDYRAAPAWYAPDLLRDILAAKTQHEIACHTFSHIDCSDGTCPPKVMDAELAECQRLAAEWGIELRSFVFPGNLAGNLSTLKKHGFTAYRWHGHCELDVPQQDEHGLWRIPGGVCWEKPEGWPVKAWIGALCRCVDRALETGTALHLWFHPSCEMVDVEEVCPAVLDYLAAYRNDVWITTMGSLPVFSSTGR
jgi:peptidoglycan/xylan/chitin deacetylase (PgdA/CDA1 family)